jgi:hypothetical protein
MPIGHKRSGGEEYKFINDLLKNHPERTQKIGKGIDYFEVELLMNSKHIIIHRVDGTTTDMSYTLCGGKPPKTPRQLLIDAMRSAIQKQINKFKLNIKCCKMCNIQCHHYEIHHKVEFIKLANTFISSWKKPIPNKFDDDDISRATFKKIDYDYEIAWRRYHKKTCELMALCHQCHSKLTYF